jgi:hypothetical protein
LRLIRLCVLVCSTVIFAIASEHRGVVRFGGLPVPGATVTVSQGEKKLVTITDQQGIYTFSDLTDGVWVLDIEMLAFEKLQREIAVSAGAAAAEWDLKVLPFETIQASAPPPSPSTPVTGVAMAKSPEAAKPDMPVKKGAKAKNAPPEPASNGQFRRTDVNASSEAPPAEAESLAPGEMNQSASNAFVVNGSTSGAVERRAIGNARKGPASMYRGDLSTVVDNSALNARPFSLTGQETPRQAYNHLKFGASFGGPVYIPHVYRTDATKPLNFFINYQLTRNRNATTQTGLMPTGAERGGDLSGLVDPLGRPVQIYDPATGLPIAGNQIPQAMISPQAKALLRLYPLPNFAASSRYNYQIPIIGRGSQDDLQSRINKTFNRDNFVNGSVAYRRSHNDGPNLFGFLDNTEIRGITANLSWRHVFTKEWSGTLSYGFSRMSTRNAPFFAGRENISGNAGITGNNQDPLNWGPPSLTFSSGIAGLSDVQQSFARNQTSSISYSGFWIRRPHNITFGADYRRLQGNLLAQQDPRGSFTFTGLAAGSDWAGFLLGVPDASAIAFGNADKYFRSSMSDVYISDDWRASSSFTLNAGLRWEYGSPISEVYGRLVNLDVAPGFSAVTPVIGLQPSGGLSGVHYPASLLRPDYRGIQPRIGFAWHPLFGSSLVVRGGYGVTFNTSVYQSIAMQMAQQSPLSKSLSVSNSAANPLTMANGFLASPGVTQTTFAIDPDFRVGYVHTWQLSVQRDLPTGLVATGTYLGIKGTRGVQEFVPNTYPDGAANPCPACPSGYIYEASNGNSTRHAGQLQLRRRFHGGVAASLQYMFSKAIDNAALGGRGQGSAVIAQNWLDLSAERGLSSFDQRHTVSIQSQYSTGVGVHGGAMLTGWKGAIVKGWTITTQVTAGTGMPLTPVYLAPVGKTGVTGSIRPDYTGASLNAAPAGRYLNPLAFQPASNGRWGNAGRNTVTGPLQFQLNASFGRQFDDFDLRFDATNVLNHVTFPSWNTVVNNAQFGLPIQANGMRTLQANLRWRF